MSWQPRSEEAVREYYRGIFPDSNDSDLTSQLLSGNVVTLVEKTSISVAGDRLIHPKVRKVADDLTCAVGYRAMRLLGLRRDEEMPHSNTSKKTFDRIPKTLTCYKGTYVKLATGGLENCRVSLHTPDSLPDPTVTDVEEAGFFSPFQEERDALTLLQQEVSERQWLSTDDGRPVRLPSILAEFTTEVLSGGVNRGALVGLLAITTYKNPTAAAEVAGWPVNALSYRVALGGTARRFVRYPTSRGRR